MSVLHDTIKALQKALRAAEAERDDAKTDLRQARSVLHQAVGCSAKPESTSDMAKILVEGHRVARAEVARLREAAEHCMRMVVVEGWGVEQVYKHLKKSLAAQPEPGAATETFRKAAEHCTGEMFGEQAAIKPEPRHSHVPPQANDGGASFGAELPGAAQEGQ